jgi:hypothetical protein
MYNDLREHLARAQKLSNKNSSIKNKTLRLSRFMRVVFFWLNQMLGSPLQPHT